MSAPTSSTSRPGSFILPDLVGHCHFPLTYHPDGDAVAAQSVRWLDEGCPELSQKARTALYGLQAGELTAYCYPYCTADRLRVVSDFMNFLFHLDNISDGMMRKGTEALSDIVMNALWLPDHYVPTSCPGKPQPATEPSAGKMARDYWRRCIEDAKPGPQARFKENLELFFEAVHQQARDREAGVIPDLESYISVRRDTSGCKPVFDLIEYAMDIDLPDFVVAHPVIKALNEGANDLVTWSNVSYRMPLEPRLLPHLTILVQDIFSFNVEQSRGDTHNMIPILMKLRGLDLQGAVDFVGDLCKQTIDAFVDNQQNIPSFGPDIDRDVAMYVQGLQDWIVGSLHWSFMTERYFGKAGAEVKKHRVVTLLPRKCGDRDIDAERLAGRHQHRREMPRAFPGSPMPRKQRSSAVMLGSLLAYIPLFALFAFGVPLSLYTYSRRFTGLFR
ncbi:terpenoid synthase [Trametes coccinea BRFM310]|uniref:Terpene synthase n=1 Tax=Trametes coccinea (strain BRFM310) TaxID=1353009 RepID=A0A1Y2J5Y6_TRAC3|nr:terpenoid synthase [Trametes coccinea BRFM310]